MYLIVIGPIILGALASLAFAAINFKEMKSYRGRASLAAREKQHHLTLMVVFLSLGIFALLGAIVIVDYLPEPTPSRVGSFVFGETC